MVRIRKDRAGHEHRDLGAGGGVEREIDPLLRADAAQRQGVAPLAQARKGVCVDAEPYGLEQAGGRGCAARLVGRDGDEPGPGPLGRERGRLVTIQRQVQGDQHRNVRRRQVAVEVQPVQVDEVDPLAPQEPVQRRADAGLDARAGEGVDLAGHGRDLTSSPAAREPSQASTIDRQPRATRPSSSRLRICSAPPTGSALTGAKGKATLRTVGVKPGRPRPHARAPLDRWGQIEPI